MRWLSGTARRRMQGPGLTRTFERCLGEVFVFFGCEFFQAEGERREVKGR